MYISRDIFDAYLAKYYPRGVRRLNILSREERAQYRAFAKKARSGIDAIAAKRGTKKAPGFLRSLAHNGLHLSDGRMVAPDDLWRQVTEVSWALFEYRPEQFTPLVPTSWFPLIERVHEVLGLPMPPVPAQRHRRERFLYYGALNEIWQQERIANGLAPDEFQVYLYEFGQHFVDPQELETTEPDPFRAWVAVAGRFVEDHELLSGWSPGRRSTGRCRPASARGTSCSCTRQRRPQRSSR